MIEAEEALPVVARLARKYAGNDSTSIPYETAGQLMEAALYCIREGERRLAASALPTQSKPTAQALYDLGLEAIRQKALFCRMKYERLQRTFQSYGVSFYEEAVTREIPFFLTHYDVLFSPHEHGIALSYPTRRPIGDLQGVHAVSVYLSYLSMEQRFLSTLSEQFVRGALHFYSAEYRDLPFNLCGVVLRSVIGHAIAQKTLRLPELNAADYREIAAFFKDRNRAQTEELLKSLILECVRAAGLGDEMAEYLLSGIEGDARELDWALRSKRLESFFKQ